jgi:hypothetical protein
MEYARNRRHHLTSANLFVFDALFLVRNNGCGQRNSVFKSVNNFFYILIAAQMLDALKVAHESKRTFVFGIIGGHWLSEGH